MSAICCALLSLASVAASPTGADETSAIADAIRRAGDGGSVVLGAGRHFIRGVVPVDGLRDFTLRGETGAVVVVHASATGTLNECNNAFVVRDCERFAMENVVFTTDAPTSAAGRLVAADRKAGTFDVRLDSGSCVSGGEHVACIDSCAESGMPDRLLEMSGRLRQERGVDGRTVVSVDGVYFSVVAPDTLRFTAPGGPAFDFSRLRLGHRFALRYSLWGGGLVTFLRTRGAAVRDVTVERCNAMAFVVGEGCADFSFKRLSVCPTPGTAFSSNADGIHVVGLSGTLSLDECLFERLGDDALNVHARAYVVKGGTVPPGLENAPVVVYDPNTFRIKARGTAATLCLSDGDVVADARHFPSVRIRDTICRAMRARGFLVQTGDVLIERCAFRGIGRPAILCAPDIERWFELGPCSGVEIRNSVFDGCDAATPADSAAAVAFRTSHGVGEKPYPPGVHSGVRIAGNRFTRTRGAAVSLESTSDIELHGNDFDKPNPVRLVKCSGVRQTE